MMAPEPDDRHRVNKEGRRISVGALGARRIITAVAQVLDNAITYEDAVATAGDRPRVHA